MDTMPYFHGIYRLGNKSEVKQLLTGTSKRTGRYEGKEQEVPNLKGEGRGASLRR